MFYKKINYLVEDLPPLPEIISLLMIELSSEEPNFYNIEKLISKDPFLTTKILNISNSAMFSLFKKINNIGEALQFIGYKKLLNLVMLAGMSKNFKTIDKDSLYSFWQYSLNISNLSQNIAKSVAGVDSDTALTIGLIHAIGELILINKLPLKMEEINKENSMLSLNRNISERNSLGFCYLDVSHKFIKKNKFSSLIVSTINELVDLSFKSEDFENYSNLSLIIHLSIWRTRYHLEKSSEEIIIPEIEQKIIKYLGLKEKNVTNQDISFWVSKEDVAIII